MTGIQAAAIRAPDGQVFSVPRPGRHHDVISLMIEAGWLAPIRGVQGFITDDGAFVDRTAALEIAKANGQIVQKHGSANLLFSEDMW